jgi:hypothetical protein
MKCQRVVSWAWSAAPSYCTIPYGDRGRSWLFTVPLLIGRKLAYLKRERHCNQGWEAWTRKSCNINEWICFVWKMYYRSSQTNHCKQILTVSIQFWFPFLLPYCSSRCQYYSRQTQFEKIARQLPLTENNTVLVKFSIHCAQQEWLQYPNPFQ